MKSNVLKIGGIIAIVLGSVGLFMSGTGEDIVMSIVGAVFVLAGIIAGMFKKT